MSLRAAWRGPQHGHEEGGDWGVCEASMQQLAHATPMAAPENHSWQLFERPSSDGGLGERLAHGCKLLAESRRVLQHQWGSTNGLVAGPSSSMCQQNTLTTSRAAGCDLRMCWLCTYNCTFAYLHRIAQRPCWAGLTCNLPAPATAQAA